MGFKRFVTTTVVLWASLLNVSQGANELIGDDARRPQTINARPVLH